MSAPALAGFEQKVVVGIAELAVSHAPNVALVTYSLGSCLGVSVWDPVAKAGGLLHLMLPDSALDAGKAAAHPSMFADTGVPALLRAAAQLGCDPHRLILCAAGGAQIMDSGNFFNIGLRNIEALTALCRQHGLKIHAQQTGGMVNRTLSLNVATGEVRLKVSGQKGETLLCKN